MSSMGSMSNAERRYLPAAGRDVFLPLYDLIAKMLGADKARQVLLDRVQFQPQDRVLDIGCGTGTLAVLLKQKYPSLNIVGLDPDPNALARAREKSTRAGVSVRFDRGFADALAYQNNSFDVVFSSFMFHHLESAHREKTLREVRRVLKAGGRFYLLDFEASDDVSAHGSMRLFHRSKRLQDNSAPRIVSLMEQAGLKDPRKIGTHPVFFGLGRAGIFEGVA
jgi:ubiquinone/menaquinone biosynthesis C-methylase UbiE